MDTSYFCDKCKKMLKYDNIHKARFCPDCEPNRFEDFKNDQRIQKREKDNRAFIGVANAGDVIFLNIDDLKYQCNLEFKFKKSEQYDIIKMGKSWTDNKIKTSARIIINSINSNNFILKINGIGKDNRCRWCRSFRTALTAFLNIEYQKRCRYEL